MNSMQRIYRRSLFSVVISLVFLILVFSISVDVVNGSAGAVPSQSSFALITGADASLDSYVSATGSLAVASSRPEQTHLYEFRLVMK